MKHEQNKPTNLDPNKDILDELSEDELTDLELDPVSGGVVNTPPTIEMPPLFIQVKKPKPTTVHPH